jgi:tetratricopeptide (TPR) repeat protein
MRFFGRDAEARSLQSTWQETRLVVLHGSSACGKTSLLRAGVLPLLDIRPRALVLPVAKLSVRRSAERPSAARLTGIGTSALLHTWGSGEQQQPGRSLTDFLVSRLELSGASGRPARLMAAIDQFEMFFTLSREERSSTLRGLAKALGNIPELRLLLVISDDCLDDFKSSEAAWGVSPTYFELKDLSSKGALAAINRPLINTELAFGDGVAEELLDELRDASNQDGITQETNGESSLVRPLFLQLLCYQLWLRMNPSGGYVTFEALRAADGIDEAIVHFYNEVVTEACLATRQPESQVRAWVEGKFVTRTGVPRVIRRGAKVTAGMSNDVLDALTAMHVLKIVRRSFSTCYTLDGNRLSGAIVVANREWRAVFEGNGPEQDPDADTATAYADAAQEALSEGDVATARRLAGLAVEWYRKAGEERRLAHLLMLKGDIALAQGDLESTEFNYQAALAQFTVLEDRNQIAHALSMLGELHSCMGDYGTAADFHQSAIDYLPTDMDALVGLGYAQWYEGFPADADATFTRALAWQPNSATALAGRGQVRAEMQEYVAALTDLSRALAAGLSAEDETDAMTARALALTALGRTVEAESELDRARARAPHRARTLFRAARMAAMKGQAGLAAQELQEGLVSGPRVPSREESNARNVVKKLVGVILN